MFYEDILDVLTKVKNGVFTRFGYKTNLPMKAAYAEMGYNIEKVTEMTVRFGINYGNIASVKERKAMKPANENKKPRANNFVPVIPNKVYHNTNTGRFYVSAFPTKSGRNTKTYYNITLANGEVLRQCQEIPAVFKNLVQDCYWDRKNDNGEMFRVAVENILLIGKVGTKIYG